MVQFQQMMEHFLETQRSVMLAYLQEVEGTTPRRDGAPKATASPLPAPSRPEWPMEPSTGSQSPVAPPTPAAVGSHGPDSAAVPDSAARPLPSAEWLTQQLLHIVSERTGYPPEMLDLDVDIEASLGIDSIKRVEILGTLRRECLPADHQIAPGAMEQLTGIKTLRGIIQWLDAALRAGGASEAGEATVQPPEMTVVERSDAPTDPAIASASQDGVPRSTLIAVEAPPLPDLSIHFEPERVFLLTEDGRGIAATLAEEIRRRGGRAVRVGPLEASDPTDKDVIRADIGDPSVASDVVARVREQHGPISGLIHLLPLREVPDLEGMDLAAWRARLRREVKGLVYLAQAAAKDLMRAGETASAWVMAAAFIDGASEGTTGGRLPRWRRASGMALARQEAARLAHFPGHVGVAGLMKTLAQEWPAVACKVVHLDAANSPHDLADQLLREMVADDGLVEVSYLGSQRRCFRPIPAPLDESGPPYLTIESDWVVLVTGGARGITAEVACELAERYRPTLLLVGSSPPPAAEEPAQTAGLTSPQQLKAALVEHMREGSEPVTLAQVEAAYRRLLKEREVRRNLARMREAGARVSYYQVDVRDEQAMAHLVEQAYRRFGRLDGVIHGAGVIEDKLIEDKPPDSFDRVFDTKTDGAFLLGRVLRADSVRFLAFFSSTAGPFGNRGQSDYAAANEVLNGLAAHLDRRWPGRVMSLNWGPWMTGMVSPELQREFARRNIQLLSARQGRAAFDRELRFGRKGEAEIILARGDWGGPSPEGGSAAQPAPPTKENASPPADASDHGRFPLLQHARMSNGNGRLVEAVRALDPSVDLYLADHRLDGKPVFPLAMAMELMAEVVQHGWPDRTVIGLRDLQVLKGVILEDGPEKVRVVARAPTEPLPEPPHVHVPVEILGEESGRVFYRATVELADALPALTPYPPPALDGLQRFPLSVAEAYRQWLFHGPLFQGLSAVEGISPDGLVATCRPSSPQRCLADNAAGQWLIDPMVFDSALQSIILWTRFYLDATPLPSRFNRYRRFGSLSAPEIRCYLQVPAQPGGNLFWVNIAFVAGGDLVGLLEGMECPASKALNRLSERRRRV
jgi:NAD(P)-dependent dehydrogenase (short-subunit alcohol dehydrogenase family)